MWHGILVDAAFDRDFFHKMKIIGKKKSGKWVLLKIEAKNNDVDRIARLIQENMKDDFYSHLYNKYGSLIVIFKDRIFKIKSEKITWKQAVAYGKSIEIPGEQLDFYPCRFEDEDY